MTLTLALNAAVSGLNISQKALAVISNNIANANTDGYTRQQLDISADYLNGQIAGVTAEDITRKVDKYLQVSVRNQSSIVGRTSVLSEYYQRMQTLMGNPSDANSLDEYTSEFFTALQSLSETPDRTSFREQVIGSANVLARELSSLADGLQALRKQADEDISNSVDEVNRLISTLNATNIAINRANALGNPTAGLYDKRDETLNALSEFLDISTYTQETGEVFIYTAKGITLLDKNLYQLSYHEAGSQDVLNDGQDLNALEVVLYENGLVVSHEPQELLTRGTGDAVTTDLKQGKILGLHELRDEIIPDILAQLDEYAAMLRDTVNEIHNQGSSYPGTNELTGTRLVNPYDAYNWEGSVRFAIMDENGNPAPTAYADEQGTGVRALTLDLAKLDDGTGNYQPSLQNIIDEINNHFWPPAIKTETGNLNNVQLVSDTMYLPQAPMSFSFDFDLDNISNFSSNFYVTDITVLDDTATNITNVSQTPPQVTVSTITTTTGSNAITITSANHGLSVGDRVYLSDPGVAVNGISNGYLNGYFEITAVTGNTFDIQLSSAASATATGTVPMVGMTATPPWSSVAAGEKTRINEDGTVTLDLTGNAGSDYYDITVTVGVDDGQGSANDITTSTITYRIYNNTKNMFNDRYNSTAVTGNAQRVIPTSDQFYMRALLVDENGVELPTQNGIYTGQNGYLKLETNNPNYTLAIDELDSKHMGVTTTSPAAKGTERGFSHYFELNNFFKSNAPTSTGDTTAGSALYFGVEDRFLENSNLISLGQLERSYQPADGSVVYTYERSSSNNAIIDRIANLADTAISFHTAGGLSSSKQTLQAYVGNILAFSASAAASSNSDNSDANVLLNGFIDRSDAYSGVNVDEELSNTIVFQHAYSASARVITTVTAMFEALLSAM